MAILFLWIKMLSFARAEERLAFIVRMLIEVFIDMKYFFIFMFWFVLGFSFMGKQMIYYYLIFIII